MSFERFTTVTGAAAPLLRTNVDTDVIIRIERLTTTEPRELARFAFEALRYRPDGTDDPSFVLNREPFRGAPILIAGANFGCGSSREPAVWALRGLRIRCIVATSFGDIFCSNCFQNGVLAIALESSVVGEIAAAAESGAELTIDLRACRIATELRSWSFDVEAPLRASLLEGLDDFEIALRAAPRVAEWETRDRSERPWAWFPERGRVREDEMRGGDE